MSDLANQSLTLSKDVYQQLLFEAEESYPNECIGLVFSGNAGLRTKALKNVAQNPQVTYLAEPLELLQALKQADENDDDLVAIYHSHPQGPNHPSETDLAKAYYDVPALIILPKEKKIYGFILDTKEADQKKEDDQSHPLDYSGYYEIELVLR